MVQLEFHKYFMFPVSNYENFDKDCSTNKSEEIMWQFSARTTQWGISPFCTMWQQKFWKFSFVGSFSKIARWHMTPSNVIQCVFILTLTTVAAWYQIYSEYILHYLFNVGDYYFVWVVSRAYEFWSMSNVYCWKVQILLCFHPSRNYEWYQDETRLPCHSLNTTSPMLDVFVMSAHTQLNGCYEQKHKKQIIAH